MKVTYNWLKDFVAIKIPAQALADKLTMAGIEVTSLEERSGDFVFEIEVTSNRPDWLSVVGIAREVAAITGTKLKLPRSPGHQVTRSPGQKPIAINIENKKDCPLYTAKIIQKVKVGASPEWLKNRLELVGCRSVNNIVDITNYILFTFGEPLHAFDLDKLNPDEIIVRRAREGEEITTIDGIKRALNPQALVIADNKRAVAIAGIMGGKDTEVTASTKNILLEAAIFNPIIVRRARQQLGLQSESAYRFERGVPLEIAREASSRAVKLIQESAGGKCVAAKDAGLSKNLKKKINLSRLAVNKILGIDIAAYRIKKILESLGFKAKGKNNFTVDVPCYRQDVNLEIDLIEEIARVYGYALIPASVPAVRPSPTPCRTGDLVSLVKNTLAGLGLNEVITYSLVDKELLNSFGKAGDSNIIAILNPLSREQEALRPQLIPSLSRCVANNLNQKQEYVNIFEIAHVFSKDSAAPLPEEELTLGMALCGQQSFFLGEGLVKEEAGPLSLKGVLEALFQKLGIQDYDFMAQGPCSFSILLSREKIGTLAELTQAQQEALGIKNKTVFALEISLEKVFAQAQLKKKFTPAPRYPGITRDISFILREDVLVKDILQAAKEAGQPLLSAVKIADYYQGKQIPAGERGLTISCLYRRAERTLTEAEINPLHANICSVLTGRFGAKMR